MAIKTLLNTQNKPASASAALEAAGFDLYELHHDMEVLAWGCDQLWHSHFTPADDNEFLSHFPLAVLRSLTSRTGELYNAVEELKKGGVA